jgi:anti-sigma B factor antagonist
VNQPAAGNMKISAKQLNRAWRTPCAPGVRLRSCLRLAVACVSERTEGSLTASPQQLAVEVHPGGASTLVILRGELDLASAPEAAAALGDVAEGGERHVVVDVGELAFLDVAGMHLLEAVADRLAAKGGRMVLRHPSGPVRRLLDLRRTWAPADPGGIEPEGVTR